VLVWCVRQNCCRLLLSIVLGTLGLSTITVIGLGVDVCFFPILVQVTTPIVAVVGACKENLDGRWGDCFFVTYSFILAIV
jgi:hypothetical protein